jgi:hypothetical protein
VISRLRRKSVVYSLELLVLLFAAYHYSSDYITRPRSYVPTGGDYGVSIFGRFFWDDVRACGTCALWRGAFLGGNPSFLDVSSDLFHPVAAIPSIVWGTLYGSRVTVTLTFMLAGISMWWLAQVLETGTLARLTAGLLGITGGYLTGRLQHGLVVMALSVVTASFLLPAMLLLFRNPTRRHAALVGFFGGLTALSGQAYIQIAMVCLAPIFAILFFSNLPAYQVIFRRLLQAAAMALSIASVQLLPTLHWWGRLGKDTDFNFPRAQDFRFVATNLVINDWDFYNTPILDREGGYPGLYSNYIGWVALILAVIGLIALAQRSKSSAAFLGMFILGALWLSSGMLFIWLSRWNGHWGLQTFAAGIRTPSNIANLAVPAIIGLVSVGIQYLLDAARRWHRFRLHLRFGAHTVPVTLSLAIFVPILAFVMVRNVANERRHWMGLEDWNNNAESQIGAALESPELRWISDYSYNPRLLILADRYHLKIGNATRPWWIDDKFVPLAWGVLGTQDPPAGYVETFIDGVPVLVHRAGNPYARILTNGGHELTCAANGRGGHIQIHCPGGSSGTLLVSERAFPGWVAAVDGEQAVVDLDGAWLEIDVPNGASVIDLTFNARLFWVGVALSAIGISWAIWWLARPGFLTFRPIQPRGAHRESEIARSS